MDAPAADTPDLIEVTWTDNTIRKVPFGTPLTAVLTEVGDPPLAAIVNGETVDLSTRVVDPITVTPLHLSNRAGFAVYARSVCFLTALAVRNVVPGGSLRIRHAVNSELVGAITDAAGLPVIGDALAPVAAEMRRLVAEDLPIERLKMKRDKAVELFAAASMPDKVAVMRSTNRAYVTLYRCDGYHDYLYGALVPSTGRLATLEFDALDGGFLIKLPSKRPPHDIAPAAPMPKLRAAFDATERWAGQLSVDDVAEVNAHLRDDDGLDLVLVSEAHQEKRIAELADAIAARRDETRLVLIAGPSSSGKTTFSKRLAVQLRVLGFEPFSISADDYFHNRDETPLGPDGKPDFEALTSLDVPTLDRDLNALLAGQEVALPRFDFVSGKRVDSGVRYRMGPRSLLIVEGIHGLNPDMTPSLPATAKFRVYVSALTPLNLDDHTSVYVSDVRTLRRMARDARTRGNDAERTLTTWPAVRQGEARNIFPFQEEADVIFNSSLLYELNALRPLVTPLLQQVDLASPAYGEAMRMLEFLSFFAPMEHRHVPATSIMREFIGGSCFE